MCTAGRCQGTGRHITRTIRQGSKVIGNNYCHVTYLTLNKTHRSFLCFEMDCRIYLCLVAVSAVGAVLDGTKLFRETRTRLKSSKPSIELPTGVLAQLKRNKEVYFTRQSQYSTLERSRREDKSCGFDTSVELEISPVRNMILLKFH